MTICEVKSMNSFCELMRILVCTNPANSHVSLLSLPPSLPC